MAHSNDVAREVFRVEAEAIAGLAGRLDASFERAVRAILECKGRVVVSGMGKAGLVGQKISATLASTGTPSLSLHPAEAVHGDLGRITAADVLLALSNSGETEEILRLVPPAKRIGATVISICSKRDCALGGLSDIVLELGPVTEADPLNLVPTASSAALLALGDALAMAVMRERKFTAEDFAAYHPAGDLGRKLMKIREVMRTGERNPVCGPSATVRDAIVVMSKTPGRPGSTSVVAADGKLLGFFTDGDLRRLLQTRPAAILDEPVSNVMTKSPKTLDPDHLAAEALRILQSFEIDQAPVADAQGRAIGLLDVQDLLRVGLI